MILRPRCQRQTFVADHTLPQQLHGRLYRGLGIRSGIGRVLGGPRAIPPRLGEPSAFAPGDWVRVLDASRLRGALDARSRTRGLLFAPQQGGTCGSLARVARVVRRIGDDDGRMRAVSRTVLLEGITCGGVDGQAGCGRLCPLLFRDEWLERAEPPRVEPPAEGRDATWAWVRSTADIESTLDARGRRGGVMAVAETTRFAGRRLRVLRRLDRVFEADRDAVVREPIYLLEGAACSGASLGADGPCDRGCPLLWHRDWLDLDAPGARRPPRIASLAHPTAHDLEDWRRASDGSPAFLAPEFFRLTARHTHALDARVVLAPDGGGRGGALALRREGRELRALDGDPTPRFDMTGDASALPAIWSALRDEATWDVLSLEDVPATSPLAAALLDLARADGFLVATRPGLRSPWFDLDGWESRLSSKFRRNLGRCARNLGEATLERIERFDRAALSEGLAIERASWKGDRGTAIDCDADRRGFYVALLRALAPRGGIVLDFLRAKGRRVAFEIGLEDATTHYALKIAFDPELAAFSPGHLLVERIVEDARRRGLRRFDFLGWDQEWKRKWTDRALEHTTLVVYRPGARGWLSYAAREIVRPRLVGLKHRVEAARARVCDLERVQPARTVQHEVDRDARPGPPGVQRVAPTAGPSFPFCVASWNWRTLVPGT